MTIFNSANWCSAPRKMVTLAVDELAGSYEDIPIAGIDPRTPEGEIHALAEKLRLHKNRRVGLSLSDRCDDRFVTGTVMRVNVTSTAVYLRVKGRKVHVPLNEVVGLDVQ